MANIADLQSTSIRPASAGTPSQATEEPKLLDSLEGRTVEQETAPNPRANSATHQQQQRENIAVTTTLDQLPVPEAKDLTDRSAEAGGAKEAGTSRLSRFMESVRNFFGRIFGGIGAGFKTLGGRKATKANQLFGVQRKIPESKPIPPFGQQVKELEKQLSGALADTIRPRKTVTVKEVHLLKHQRSSMTGRAQIFSMIVTNRSKKLAGHFSRLNPENQKNYNTHMKQLNALLQAHGNSENMNQEDALLAANSIRELDKIYKEIEIMDKKTTPHDDILSDVDVLIHGTKGPPVTIQRGSIIENDKIMTMAIGRNPRIDS